MSRSRPTVVALLTALALALFAAAPATHAAGSVRVGAAPALPAGAQALGAAPAEQQLRLYVALEPRDPAALERFATEASTPGSPLYGQYLSLPQFAQRFGATGTQVAAARSALVGRGLRVGPTGANGLSLPLTATVAEAEAAFGLSIDRVRTSSGRIAYANDRAPAIPAAAAPFIQGVLGLNDVVLPHRHDAGAKRSPLAAPSALAPRGAITSAVGSGGPQPCQEALEVRESLGGYTADQIAAAYGFDDLHAAGDSGAGQTVALLELEPVLEEDIDIYQACYGTDVELARVDVAGGPEPGSSEDGEAALDVEQLIGLAPGIRIRVYQGPNEGDTMAEIVAKWVQENVAKVMSSSWGSCEPRSEKSEMAAFDTLLQEAAAQGQSFFVAAGDYGSTDCYDEIKHDTSLAVDFPGSDPWATDVGGTRLEDPTAATPTEYLWNDAPGWGAGGGGRSEQFPMPAYQLNAAAGLNVLGPLSSGETCGFSGYCRQVPDVSAQASDVNGETGYVIHAEGAWERNGGTSAAAPLWAAAAALVNANPACGGHTIGFANPALYAIAATDYAANFQDVTTQKPGGKPTTDRYVEGEPFPAGPYYDMASGLGTPVVPGLAASLCALASPPAPPAPAKSVAPPAPAPAAANVPTVGRAALTGIAGGKPKLVFTVTARPGSKLQTVVVQLPPALLTDDPTNTFRFGLRKPRASAKLKLAYPAIRVSPKLRQHVKSGVTKRLGFVVATRESGGKGARLPLVLPLS
jgi:subtilase family serine protease